MVFVFLPIPIFGNKVFSSWTILLNVFAVNPTALPDSNAPSELANNFWSGAILFKAGDVDKFLLSSNLNLKTKSVNDDDAWLPFIAFGALVWLLNADSVSGAL